MYMRYRELAEKKGAGNVAPKRIIFYRGMRFPFISLHQHA